MAVGYFIRQFDKTSCDGTVLASNPDGPVINRRGQDQVLEGDPVTCGKDGKTYVIAGGIPYMTRNRRSLAGSLHSLSTCPCRAQLIPSLLAHAYEFREASAAPASRNRAQSPEVTPPTALKTRATATVTTPNPASVSFAELPGVVCQNLWRGYQKMAENIIAPGGTLIADPKARNRVINAAYAKLWLLDQRFQWAGLAAFASKQVGCGLLHAADSIDRIQAESDAGQHMVTSSERRWSFLGITLFGGHDQQAQREYDEARRNNPTPSLDIRREGESFSTVQQLYRHVYDMLALGNTTLFLDIYPLHVFYRERGLWALEKCLESRRKIHAPGNTSVLWPISQETLEFGGSHGEILKAFRAIEAGNIAKSVDSLAFHEQANILQPSMYSDPKLIVLLRGNHMAYVTGLLPGAAQAVELTLASQCRPVDDGRTIGFSNDLLADLSKLEQRMPFVLKAAAQFDVLLSGNDRHKIEAAIRDIASGRGVR